MISCASRTKLTEYVAEKLSAAENAVIETHVETCPACQKELERLTAFEADDLPIAPLPPGPSATESVSVTEVFPGRAGLYQVLEEVAHGGMGVILKVRDLRLGRDLAVKVLLEAHQGKPALVQRFLEEAQISSQLQHPGIPSVYEVGQFPDGRPYFIMKLIEGQTLAKRLKARTDLESDLPYFLLLFGHVCTTLAYAHARRIIHRDLKPSNIMVGAFGEILVMDWGLARALAADHQANGCPAKPSPSTPGAACVPPETPNAASRPSAAGGTPAYMPPEQARGEVGRLDERCDVFGLGAILCEILTGKPPYEGETDKEVHDKAVKGDLADALNRLDACGADAELIGLAKACLSFEREGRPRDAGEVAQAVTAYLASVQERLRQAEQERAAERARATEVEEKARVERRARRLMLALGVALVAVTVVSVLFALHQSLAREDLVKANVAVRQEKQRTMEALRDAERLLAEKDLDRGLIYGAQGEVGLAMLWLARSLKEVPPGSADLEWVIRMNLDAWRRELCTLRSLLHDQSGVSISTFTAAFSPDGRRLLTGGFDGIARLREASTGQPCGPPLRHQDTVRAVAFSPDGQILLTGSLNGMARLWKADTGQSIGELLGHRGPVYAAVFSPDGRTVVTASEDGTVRLWEAVTGKSLRVFQEHDQAVHNVAFSSDGQTILTGSSDGTARLWDINTGKELQRFEGHDDLVSAVAFHPKDPMIILTGSQDAKVRLWDPLKGELIRELHDWGQRAVLKALFSPDGQIVLTGSDDGVARLWETATGKVCARLPHQGGVLAATFSPDGRTVLTGSRDGTARLWDVETGRPLSQPLPHQAWIEVVAFSPDGRTVLTGGRGKTALWQAPARALLRTFERHGWITAVAFSPDGRFVLAGDNNFRVRFSEAATGTFVVKPTLQHWDVVLAVAFSPDGGKVLTGCRDGSAQLWDRTTGQSLLEPSIKHGDEIPAVAFSPDGRTLATGSSDGTAQLWDATTGKPIGQPLQAAGRTFAVAFSPDGKLLATGSGDKKARLWEVATGRLLGSPLEHEGEVRAVAFSPNGQTLLTGSEDKTARLWDVWTGEPLRPPLPHGGIVFRVAFGPDGRTVLTGSGDQTARLWDAVTGKPIGPALYHPGLVHAVAFRPDGQAFVTAGEFERARLWEVPAGVQGDADRLTLWVQVLTGLELDDHDTVRVLDVRGWHDRRQRLDQLGIPPRP